MKSSAGEGSGSSEGSAKDDSGPFGKRFCL